jgi:hypothetical protein
MQRQTLLRGRSRALAKGVPAGFSARDDPSRGSRRDRTLVLIGRTAPLWGSAAFRRWVRRTDARNRQRWIEHARTHHEAFDDGAKPR